MFVAKRQGLVRAPSANLLEAVGAVTDTTYGRCHDEQERVRQEGFGDDVADLEHEDLKFLRHGGSPWVFWV